MKKLFRILAIFLVAIFVISPSIFSFSKVDAAKYTSSVYLSPEIGGDEVDHFTSFDSLGQQMPAGTSIIYEIINAENGTSLAATEPPDYNKTYIDLANNSRFDGVKKVKVKIHLRTNNPEVAPSSSGFVVKYLPKDTQAPTVPKNISFTIEEPWEQNHRATLSWDPSIDTSGIASYQISASNFPDLVVAATNDTSYTFSGLICGTKYSYLIKALDVYGNRSVISENATLTTPDCPVTSAPEIISFEASPLTPEKGQITTLSWEVTGAENNKISINNGAGEVDAKGSVQVSPETTTQYSLEAKNSQGSIVSLLPIEVVEPQSPLPKIEKFSVTPQSISEFILPDSKEGEGISAPQAPNDITPELQIENATLSWKVEGADEVSIDNSIGENLESSGEVKITPTEKTTYTITASNASGEITSKTAVDVSPKEEVVSAPESISRELVGEDELQISWPESENATGYNVYDQENNLLASTTDTSYTFKNIEKGDVFGFAVEAHDDSGNVSKKAEIAFATPPDAETSYKVSQEQEAQKQGISLASVTSLVSTGSNIWTLIILALIAIAIVSLIITRKKPNTLVGEAQQNQTIASTSVSARKKTMGIIIAVVLVILAGVLLWANQTGKLKIFGDVDASKEKTIVSDYAMLSQGQYDKNAISIEPIGHSEVAISLISQEPTKTLIYYRNNIIHNGQFSVKTKVSDSRLNWLDIYMLVPNTWGEIQPMAEIENISPNPYNPNSSSPIYTDQFGNKSAKFRFSPFMGPQDLSFSEKFKVVTSSVATNFVYDENISYANEAGLDKATYAKTTNNERYIDVDFFKNHMPAEVQRQSAPLKKLRAIFEFVAQRITYTEFDNLDDNYDSVRVYNSGKGDCGGYASMFVAMARANGIPSRTVGGIVRSGFSGEYGAHIWAEFYLPDRGWVPVDPTFYDSGSPANVVIGEGINYFGNMENTRIILDKGTDIQYQDKAGDGSYIYVLYFDNATQIKPIFSSSFNYQETGGAAGIWTGTPPLP